MTSTARKKTKPSATQAKGEAAKAASVRSPKRGEPPVSDLQRAVSAVVKTHSMASGIYLSDLVREGLPLALANANKPIIDMMIAHAVLPRKTWEHAKKFSSHTLSPQNSERLVRILRTVEKAKEAFGDERALAWIERPSKVFEGKAPIELLTNESGSRAVEMFLDRAMHGFSS